MNEITKVTYFDLFKKAKESGSDITIFLNESGKVFRGKVLTFEDEFIILETKDNLSCVVRADEIAVVLTPSDKKTNSPTKWLGGHSPKNPLRLDGKDVRT